MSADDCPDEVEEYDPADYDEGHDACDVEDPRFNLYKDDGWSNADIGERRHLSEGEYLGPKDDLAPSPFDPEPAAYWQSVRDAQQ